MHISRQARPLVAQLLQAPTQQMLALSLSLRASLAGALFTRSLSLSISLSLSLSLSPSLTLSLSLSYTHSLSCARPFALAPHFPRRRPLRQAPMAIIALSLRSTRALFHAVAVLRNSFFAFVLSAPKPSTLYQVCGASGSSTRRDVAIPHDQHVTQCTVSLYNYFEQLFECTFHAVAVL